jgi:hypothetical protein
MFFPVPLDDELALAFPLVLTSRRMSSSLEDMYFLLFSLFPRLFPDITVVWTASLPFLFAFFVGVSTGWEGGFNCCRLRDVASVRGNFLVDELGLVELLVRLRDELLWEIITVLQ